MKKSFSLFIILSLVFCVSNSHAEKTRIVLDCDTANELDDYFAIVRALVEPSFEVVGLTSSHWRTQPNAPENTVQPSQELNEEILDIMDMEQIPHPMGSNEAMTSPETAQDSPAARHIIQMALDTPDGEKLIVLTTGAMTNLASAILLESSIKRRIVAYSMGLRYEDGKWGRNEFNAENDQNAVDCLFQATATGLEWHVMTATASKPFQLNKDETLAKLENEGGIFGYLHNVWENFVPRWNPDLSTDRWVMWDVAAVEAIVNPDLAKEELVSSPESIVTESEAWVYTSIDEEAMIDQFWSAFQTAMDAQ